MNNETTNQSHADEQKDELIIKLASLYGAESWFFKMCLISAIGWSLGVNILAPCLNIELPENITRPNGVLSGMGLVSFIILVCRKIY